eukprot:4550813-Amphidinium_carterae.1
MTSGRLCGSTFFAPNYVSEAETVVALESGSPISNFLDSHNYRNLCDTRKARLARGNRGNGIWATF